MIIRYDKGADPALPRVFEAYDNTENKIGQCEVSVASCPMIWATRPVMITIRLEGDEAADALLGAAMTYSIVEAGKTGEKACVRVALKPGDRHLDNLLDPLGFTGESSVIRLRMPLVEKPVKEELPEGLTILRDYLHDSEERRFYLERVNSIFGQRYDEEWLAERTSKPFFTRILLIDKNGAAAEMSAWAEGPCGMADHLWVHKEWRRKGVGRYLMELARQYWIGKGLSDAEVEVWDRLTPALSLAESLGFQRIGRKVEYRYMDL